MDYFDKETAHREMAIEPFVFDGQLKAEDATPLEIEVSSAAADTSALGSPGTTSLEDELEVLQARIAPYGFTLYDIGGCSPKAKKTKRACAAVIDYIAKNDELYTSMRRKCNLPYVRLLEMDGVTKKLLERHRKYLMAAVEILRGDFPQMKEYILQL